jgi:hypothetical protein
MSMAAVNPLSSTQRKIDSLRVPPHSIDAEQSVLGGLLLVPESWDRARFLSPRSSDDFPRHR